MIRRPTMWALALTALLAMPGPGAEAQPQPGDIAVIDFEAGTGCLPIPFVHGCGALFIVNPRTGARTLLSDFGNPAQGLVGRDPYAIARDASGDFWVVDQHAGATCFTPGGGCGALFRVNRFTGARTLVSDFSDPGQGPMGSRPSGVALNGGQILVTDLFGQRLFQVDPVSGARTVVSDFTNDLQGPPGGRPLGLALAGGDALVAEALLSKLLRVNLGSGQRTIVSDFLDPAQGPSGLIPTAVALNVAGTEVLVVDQVPVGGQIGLGALFSVNPVTGSRQLITDFRTGVQGPPGFNPSAVAVSDDGDILVVDFDAGSASLGALFVVDRATGRRCHLSDFGNPSQGPLGKEPSGFVIVPGGHLGAGLAAAVLPTSRSVQVGATATAFVTIVNAGCAAARDVGIALATPIDASFSYQTTDPLTNALTGTPNTKVDIPIGGSRTFVIAITPNSAFPPTDVAFTFSGTNAPPVAVLLGVNTLLLSASDTPVPDIVALMATLSGDGIVNIPGPAGTGVAAVATVNVGGAGGLITVAANTGAAVLPVSTYVCQTDALGACLAGPASSVQVQIDPGATHTFAAFVAASGFVPFDPAVNRLFVTFTDASNTIRGSTSAALRTQ